MIYFKDALIDQAKEILKLESTKDDKKAVKDIAQILDMLESREESEEYLCNVRFLDNKMKNEYPVIFNMIKTGNKMQNIKTINVVNTLNDLIDVAVEDLKADIYGILLDILIKHNVVAKIEEFIDRVE